MARRDSEAKQIRSYHMSVSTQSVVENICFTIAQLDAISRREVFERVEKMKIEDETPKPDSRHKVRISDLWGVGAELWRDESVDEYIRKERESWD
jgi:hypothetical protein